MGRFRTVALGLCALASMSIATAAAASIERAGALRPPGAGLTDNVSPSLMPAPRDTSYAIVNAMVRASQVEAAIVPPLPPRRPLSLNRRKFVACSSTLDRARRGQVGAGCPRLPIKPG
jgi:hypothetical protein